jgi:very-short-patch-repair endonuclease
MSGTARARALRREATEAEKRLWRHLRGNALQGRKFRRQHPIGPYVVDFVCMEKGLVVELDGGQHALQAARDAVRTRRLDAFGFRVIRFWNTEVLEATEGVLARIEEALESR